MTTDKKTGQNQNQKNKAADKSEKPTAPKTQATASACCGGETCCNGGKAGVTIGLLIAVLAGLYIIGQLAGTDSDNPSSSDQNTQTQQHAHLTNGTGAETAGADIKASTDSDTNTTTKTKHQTSVTNQTQATTGTHSSSGLQMLNFLEGQALRAIDDESVNKARDTLVAAARLYTALRRVEMGLDECLHRANSGNWLSPDVEEIKLALASLPKTWKHDRDFAGRVLVKYISVAPNKNLFDPASPVTLSTQILNWADEIVFNQLSNNTLMDHQARLGHFDVESMLSTAEENAAWQEQCKSLTEMVATKNPSFIYSTDMDRVYDILSTEQLSGEHVSDIENEIGLSDGSLFKNTLP